MGFKFDYNTPKVIAEIGCNYMGQINTVKELRNLSKQAGLEYIKLQKSNNKEFLTEI